MQRRLSRIALSMTLILVAGTAGHGDSSLPHSAVLEEAHSHWVFPDSAGKLIYKTRPQGDRILDFSFAGYRGGGVKLPSAAVQCSVSASGGDDTAAIQQAIDTVSQREPKQGFRGAIQLAPGTFSCSRTLILKTSGVVLRGSGSGTNGTILRMTGKPHICLTIAGAASATESGPSSPITDSYVPSGATTLSVASATPFHAGDTVYIRRPTTDAWVAFMGMDKLERSGSKELWVSGVIETERVIQRISGSRITLDIPLTDSFDARYLSPPGCSVVKAVVSGRISDVGVENLRIVSPPQPVTIAEPHHQAIGINGAEDAWLKNIAIEDTVDSVTIGSKAKRVTVANVSVQHSVATKGAAKPADFAIDGSQILFDRCSGRGNNLFYFMTRSRVTGPNVLLNCTFHGNGHIEPHMRWATGLLLDGCQVPESGIDLINRGEMGSGHGWAIGWAVAWNCTARTFVVQEPPGAANWAVGCQGARETAVMPFNHELKLPEGTYDSHGIPVAPASLYLAQLRERLGPEAVGNIGY